MMLALYLLAAHLVGDYVLQTRWQAVGKFAPPGKLDSLQSFDLRAKHVTAYCLPFVPIAIVYTDDWMNVPAFMVLLWFLHFATDRQRFTSTLGDWVAWNLTVSDDEKREALSRPSPHSPYILMVPGENHPLRLPPNPWPTLPLSIDQTLHVCQLALLGGVFLHG